MAKVLIVPFFISILFVLSNSVQVRLSPNYLLDYNVNVTKSEIEFKIEAANVVGWVGLGINNISGNLKGSDLYIAGYNAPLGLAYGWDFYVPLNSASGRPIRDKITNWQLPFANETDRTTRLVITRPLDTKDTENDVVIQNKTMFLIWMYNSESDDVEQTHTHIGNVSINLFSKDNSGGGGKPPVGNAASQFALGKLTMIFTVTSLVVLLSK